MKKYIFLSLFVLMNAFIFTGCSKDNSSTNDANSGTGTGGSLARFIIVGNYLYVVDHQQLITYSINGLDVQKVHEQQIGFNIETIFNMDDKLFIGSQNAMYIYSLASPTTPTYLSSATHLRACDPVVANNTTAFVTVRSASTATEACGGNIDALLVYNIINIQNPILLNTVPLHNPRGLALNGNALYVCDGPEGLKVFNTSQLTNNNVAPITTIIDSENVFFDCIAINGYLYTMMDNGFKIYDISNPFQPLLKGHLIH